MCSWPRRTASHTSSNGCDHWPPAVGQVVAPRQPVRVVLEAEVAASDRAQRHHGATMLDRRLGAPQSGRGDSQNISSLTNLSGGVAERVAVRHAPDDAKPDRAQLVERLRENRVGCSPLAERLGERVDVDADLVPELLELEGARRGSPRPSSASRAAGSRWTSSRARTPTRAIASAVSKEPGLSSTSWRRPITRSAVSPFQMSRIGTTRSASESRSLSNSRGRRRRRVR